ncbi:MAG: DUF1853 family protein [Motiliproteus sp.]
MSDSVDLNLCAVTNSNRRSPPYPAYPNASAINSACPLNSLQHSCVRDLAWCLTSSPIYRLMPDRLHINALFTPRSELWRWLRSLDLHPEPLYQAIATQRSNRIGIYYETLFGFALANFHQPAALRYAVAVRHNGQSCTGLTKGTQTLGEYDFLYRLPGQAALTHIELSLKFYLARTDENSSVINWVGLNPADRMIDKHDKMLHKQLQLGRNPQALTQLGQSHGQIGARLGLMLGRLFYRYDCDPQPRPAGVQASHLRGWWIDASQYQRLMEPRPSDPLLSRRSRLCLIPLSKRQWLAPLTPQEAQRAAQYSRFEQKPYPQMLARLVDTTDGWREHDRVVIVP